MSRRLAVGAALVGAVIGCQRASAGGEADLVVLGSWEQAMPSMDRLAREKGLALRSLRPTELEAPDLAARVGEPRLVLVLNGPSEHPAEFLALLRRLRAQQRPIVALDQRPWQGALVADGTIRKDETLERYWRFSTERNLSHLLDYVATRYLGERREVAPPELVPPEGLYHPEAPSIATTLEEFQRWSAGRQAAGAAKAVYVVHPSFLFLHETKDIDALVRALERRGLAVYTVFADREEALRKLILAIGPDLLLTQRHTGLGRPADGSQPIPLLLDVPYLKPVSALQTTVEEWRTRPEGLRPGDLAGQVIAQELEGTIEPLVISAQETAGEYRIQTPIPDRIERFADRAASWVALRRTPPAAKRLAVVYYNADLGGESLGQGSVSGMFLDGPESLVRVTRALRDRGYRLTPPADRAALVERMRRSGKNHGPWAQAAIDELARQPDTVLVKLADYLAWFQRDLTARQRAEVVTAHGEPPGKLMVTSIHGEPELVIPRVVLGPGVALFPQPEKGARQDSRLVHDPSQPPSHQYIAFYLWLREVWRPHAIVHFGTHGTLELLPRRAAGLGEDDYADALLGATPNVNPWILDNVAEATLARRRAWAVLVDHLTPAIEKTKLDRTLGSLLEDVDRAQSLEAGPVRDAFRRTVVAKMRAAPFAVDLLSAGQAALGDEQLRELDQRLHAAQEEQAPRSLHVLGRVPPDERRPGFIASILGRGFLERAGGRERAEALVRCATLAGRVPATCASSSPEPARAKLATDLVAARRLEADLRRAPDEITNLVAALDGRHVPPGPGNDPVRNPAALPTGRNLYALDPEQVPSAPAAEVGRTLAGQLLAEFQSKHGAPPRKVAINLNGFETMRDTGVTEGQVLALIGVEPVRDERGLVSAVRLVPRAQLGRPRVDVVLAISGQYRDNFASRIKLLDRAIRLAEESPEADNPLAAHTAAATAELARKGLSPERAAKLARVRIYGQPPGQYGTQLLYLLPRSGAWTDRAELAKVYRENMRFAYGEGVWGEQSDEGYQAAVAGTDAVSHVWSSNLMSPLTNHHVYEYLGGLSMSVEDVTGKRPDALIADARDPSRSRMRGLAEVLSTEGSVRLLNEQWIRDMQKDGYAGAGHVAAYAENLFGWATTTPGSVEARIFARVDELYLRDAAKLGARRWLEEQNPAALASVTVTLLESARRGYWKPSDADRDQLVADYVGQVGRHGEPTGMMAGGNQALRDYVRKVYEAPGSAVPRAAAKAYEARLRRADAAEQPARRSLAAAIDQATEAGKAAAHDRIVEGKVMKPAPQPQAPKVAPRATLPLAALAALALTVAGFVSGLRSARPRRRSQEGKS